MEVSSAVWGVEEAGQAASNSGQVPTASSLTHLLRPWARLLPQIPAAEAILGCMGKLTSSVPPVKRMARNTGGRVVHVWACVLVYTATATLHCFEGYPRSLERCSRAARVDIVLVCKQAAAPTGTPWKCIDTRHQCAAPALITMPSCCSSSAPGLLDRFDQPEVGPNCGSCT